MIGVTNLVDALSFLAKAEIAGTAPQIFHASDGMAFSLRDLVATIRKILGRPANLVNVPPSLLKGALRLIGLRGWSQKLLGDLEIDISTLLALGWRPPVGPEFDLQRMARATVEATDK
jgi:UDP-glucose 4-epimerase